MVPPFPDEEMEAKKSLTTCSGSQSGFSVKIGLIPNPHEARKVPFPSWGLAATQGRQDVVRGHPGIATPSSRVTLVSYKSLLSLSSFKGSNTAILSGYFRN